MGRGSPTRALWNRAIGMCRVSGLGKERVFAPLRDFFEDCFEFRERRKWDVFLFGEKRIELRVRNVRQMVLIESALGMFWDVFDGVMTAA